MESVSSFPVDLSRRPSAMSQPACASAKAQASYVPMFAHLGLVFAAGIYLPPQLVTWFQNVAKLLG